MCKNNKKCKTCSAFKIGNTMSKRRKSRSSSVTLRKEDVIYAAAGAVGGLLANRLINQVVASQPEQTKEILGKAIPALKIAAGGYLATAKKQKREMRFLGLGIAGTGAIELGVQLAPEYIGIGDTGNLYQQIGATDPMLQLTYDPTDTYSGGGSGDLALAGMHDDVLAVQ